MLYDCRYTTTMIIWDSIWSYSTVVSDVAFSGFLLFLLLLYFFYIGSAVTLLALRLLDRLAIIPPQKVNLNLVMNRINLEKNHNGLIRVVFLKAYSRKTKFAPQSLGVYSHII